MEGKGGGDGFAGGADRGDHLQPGGEGGQVPTTRSRPIRNITLQIMIMTFSY